MKIQKTEINNDRTAFARSWENGQTYSRKSEWHPHAQSLASSSFWIGFAATTVSLRSKSDALGGTSTAGELLKNPYGCITNRIRAAGSQGGLIGNEVVLLTS